MARAATPARAGEPTGKRWASKGKPKHLEGGWTREAI